MGRSFYHRQKLLNMSSSDSGSTTTNGVHQSEESSRCFSLAEIQLATNNFDDALVVGRGGFGKVYKGFIDDGATVVAVKRLNAESKQGAKEFWTEIKTLSTLRHPHLVTLIGYSDEFGEMILVYEYMVNGTLADLLYKPSRKRYGPDFYHLEWDQRLKICIGAARGLDYLHTEQSVIHRDVKTTNILLNENWIAKISDFGLSKTGTTNQTQSHVSTEVRGTFGYLDPQYFLTHRLTMKSDVYAFGVVLFEVLCARPPVDFRVEEEQCSLAMWAQHCIKQGTLDQIIDPSLSGEIPANGLKVFAEVANKCLHNHPNGRPTMAEVVESLVVMLDDSQGNSPGSKGIISKMFLRIPSIVARGIDLKWNNWMICGCKKGFPERFQSEQFTDTGIQLCRKFSLAEIRAATNNFHEQLEVERKADIKVYIGDIAHGNLKVSIKRRIGRTSSEMNMVQFRNEIQVLSHLHHLNLLQLIGYCNEKNEMILVYEYLAKRQLYRHLYPTNNEPLPWEKRLQICIGAARGLQHLHGGTKWTIVHQNLQLTCILLDENWVAKVGGFKFSRMLPENVSSTNSNMFVADNGGYMDPEYLVSAKLTEKSDVYSFGVILLEVLCGRKPMIMTRDEDQVNLVRWFKTNIERGTVDQIIDPNLTDKIAPECLKEYVMVAEKCVRDVGIERPAMDDILSSLRSALQLQDNWRNV
ncbi:hypothetical protein RHSIM_Rhsim10G0052600 [Rhododendron simsii]|uniref:Protein kinase domain-containing protein n=1 Tax=Rhododendron simsii TaxID=118357 RepID=A0A834GF02_RHOSS|nr:hypothetical protein RHSIM_Rhsim10G0052600 [Rhododendron simsii]